MLKWFVSCDIADQAHTNGYIIEPNDLQCTAESLASGALDSRAPLRAIQPYFSRDAWVIVQETVHRKKEHSLWFCGYCHDEDDGSLKMICCDLCLEWFHWQCVGLNKTVIQKNAPWLCALCAQSTC